LTFIGRYYIIKAPPLPQEALTYRIPPLKKGLNYNSPFVKGGVGGFEISPCPSLRKRGWGRLRGEKKLHLTKNNRVVE
jgi:hypothetical protein